MKRPSAELDTDRPRPPGPGVAKLGAAPKLISHYLHPGQIFASLVHTEVTTILGSCVAICMWSPRAGGGGMNHFLLPGWASSEVASAKFGNVAFERLMERLVAMGCGPTDLRAKVFGGASMLDALRNRKDQLGARNVEVAFELLRVARIPVLSKDVGGTRGRKIAFRTDDGSVLVKLL
jgi:chemotaxis protein CheD